jgi:hypothetical protein
VPWVTRIEQEEPLELTVLSAQDVGFGRRSMVKVTMPVGDLAPAETSVTVAVQEVGWLTITVVQEAVVVVECRIAIMTIELKLLVWFVSPG